VEDKFGKVWDVKVGGCCTAAQATDILDVTIKEEVEGSSPSFSTVPIGKE